MKWSTRLCRGFQAFEMVYGGGGMVKKENEMQDCNKEGTNKGVLVSKETVVLRLQWPIYLINSVDKSKILCNKEGMCNVSIAVLSIVLIRNSIF